MQDSLAKETNAVVGVPHGISGHEMNLVSQDENQKVIKEVLKARSQQDFQSMATKFVRATVGNATASCQVFGECSLVTVTLSPNDMEDIPLEVGSRLADTARKFFKETALIDAHNSIKNTKIIDDRDKSDIVDSAEEAIEKACRESRSQFSFGAARISLDEFTQEQGVGSGGLVALVVKVGDQMSAYLIIDGNNMKAGLRERILHVMYEMGIKCGEVMTTDTHVVNGITSARLGYHPVGDAIDNDILINKMRSAISDAEKNLHEGEVSSNSIETRVRTLGSALFKNMSELIHYTSRLVAFSIVPAILISIVVFILIIIRS
jgi:putative membrane protein